MSLPSNDELLKNTHNTSRYFVEHPQVSWMTLIALLIFGVLGYWNMPQRKDPEISIRIAVAACQWPGASAEQVEQLLTKPIERTIAQNKTLHPPTASDYGLRSISLPGASFVYVQLAEDEKDARKQFSDINLRLDSLTAQLPIGSTPVVFQSDFGDTAAQMITIASPRVSASEIAVRAQDLQQRLVADRSSSGTGPGAISLVQAYPSALAQEIVLSPFRAFVTDAESRGLLRDAHIVLGSGFVAMNATTSSSATEVQQQARAFFASSVPPYQNDPDLWDTFVVDDLSKLPDALSTVAGDKYTYAELDNDSQYIAQLLRGVPQASRVERKGALPQRIYVDYSQQRLASYRIRPQDVVAAINARNVTLPGGSITTHEQTLQISPSGQYDAVNTIADTLIPTADSPRPIHLRDVAEISRSYQSPPQFLNYYTWLDAAGHWQRTRAVTVSVFMKDHEQIKNFGKEADQVLSQARQVLPSDLIIQKTSDQPVQVSENIHLFMRALLEAIVLVVIIALVGFWEWRSALLMAISIPITLAMTFGLAFMVRIDLQQVSIATLIIALGLLVDDPVVANDAIKENIAGGLTPEQAAWIGPTKLSRAIIFATATNIIAYLPFLLIKGKTGEFLYSLPVVMTAALISSRIVAMTLLPLLARYLLKPSKKPEPRMEEKREKGFYGRYYKFIQKAIERRWLVFGLSLVFILLGGLFGLTLKTEFFPQDVQYWSYIDVWLPNNAPVGLTNETMRRAEAIVRREVENFGGSEHPKLEAPTGTTHHLLQSVTSFVGGGSSRFWFSVSPEQPQPNYGEILLQLNDKNATPKLMPALQAALNREVPGAQIICRQLQINPVEYPVEVRLVSQATEDPLHENDDLQTLRNLSGKLEHVMQSANGVSVVQNDWFEASPRIHTIIDADRANLAGFTNADIALSMQASLDGLPVGQYREGDKLIPIVARSVPQERNDLVSLGSLYAISSRTGDSIPVAAVAHNDLHVEQERIRRQEQRRTVGLHVFPKPGVLASTVLSQLQPQLKDFERDLPPGYRIIIGGEKGKQDEGFDQLSKVLLVTLLGIYVALLVQFRNAVKPLIVFAATPYGIVGALIVLSLMGTPFGFMAFLGVASLIGVIISHVIVLFDFIEERHEMGEPLEEALGDAGIARLRPVLITVFATVLALFPLAIEGGPLWKPLCYAQIGGLTVATLITLVIVPVLYSIVVKDLKWVKWEQARNGEGSEQAHQ